MSPTTRLVTWLLSTITIVVLLFGYHTSTAGALQAGTAVLGSAAPGGSSGSGSPASGTPGSGSSGSGSSRSGSSTVTGPTVQTQWGPIQVEITVQDGVITDVAVPVYPSGNGRDIEINNYALPILVQETLDQQSADIDMVSGATVTSVGYRQSLQAALDQAGV